MAIQDFTAAEFDDELCTENMVVIPLVEELPVASSRNLAGTCSDVGLSAHGHEQPGQAGVVCHLDEVQVGQEGKRVPTVLGFVCAEMSSVELVPPEQASRRTAGLTNGMSFLFWSCALRGKGLAKAASAIPAELQPKSCDVGDSTYK